MDYGMTSQSAPSENLLGAHPAVEIPIVLASGEDLERGHVLGKITVGAATAAAVAGNTGNGTCGTVTLSAGAKAGVYTLTCFETATDAGDFAVEGPDGITIGVATAGSAFSAGGLSFTIADGSTNFASGDQFTVTVAAGSGKYTGFDADLANGANIAVAILAVDTDASEGDEKAIAYVHGEFQANGLSWDDEDNDKTAGLADLFATGIFVK